MDIMNNYDIVTYKFGDTDKYTNEDIWEDCTIYYMNGQIHRDNDQPAIINADGLQAWYVNGENTEITINLLLFIAMVQKYGLLMGNYTEITINLLLLMLM